MSFEFIDVVEPETDDDFPEPLDLSPRDERPLSPLFQRSVSEDSAGSSASTTRKAKTRLVSNTHTLSLSADVKLPIYVHLKVERQVCNVALKRMREFTQIQTADEQCLDSRKSTKESQ